MEIPPAVSLGGIGGLQNSRIGQGSTKGLKNLGPLHGIGWGDCRHGHPRPGGVGRRRWETGDCEPPVAAHRLIALFFGLRLQDLALGDPLGRIR